MESISVQLQHEFKQIHKVRTFSLLGIVIMLMASPLFINATQQSQDLRQRAETTNATVGATEFNATDSAASNAASTGSAHSTTDTNSYNAANYDAPYYPEISPWVFIIPGIIILLVILFN